MAHTYISNEKRSTRSETGWISKGIKVLIYGGEIEQENIPKIAIVD